MTTIYEVEEAILTLKFKNWSSPSDDPKSNEVSGEVNFETKYSISLNYRPGALINSGDS